MAIWPFNRSKLALNSAQMAKIRPKTPSLRPWAIFWPRKAFGLPISSIRSATSIRSIRRGHSPEILHRDS